MNAIEFREKYNEQQLYEVARDIIGNEIVIRSYDVHGNSKDTRRQATKPEREILEKIAYAAMVAYGHRTDENGSLNAILDMAEFTLHQFIPEANTCDSIYAPLRNATDTWFG